MDELRPILFEILLKRIKTCLDEQDAALVHERIQGREGLPRWILRRSIKEAAIRTHGRQYWRQNRRMLTEQAQVEYERAAASELEELVAAAAESDD